MALSDIFKSGEPKATVVDPLAAQKTTAANFLTGALQTPNIPTRQIAGLTPTETTAQRTLAGFAGGGISPERESAIDTLSRMLSGSGDDFANTPEFRSILDVINQGTDDRVNQAIRRTKLEGVDRSNVQGGAVGREIARGRTAQTAALAPFAESERNRKLATADLLSRLVGEREQSTIGRLGAVQQFGALPREISQAEKDAQFQSLLQEILFPSTQGANVASRILGGSIDTAVQPGAPSLFAQGAPLIGSLGGAAIKAGATRDLASSVRGLSVRGLAA